MDASNAPQMQHGRLDLNSATIHHLPLSTIHHPPFKSTIHHSPYIPCHLGPSRVITSHPVLDFLISNAPSKQRKRSSNAPQTHFLCHLMPNGRLKRTSNAKWTIGLGHNVHPSHALRLSDLKRTFKATQTHASDAPQTQNGRLGRLSEESFL